MPSRDSEIVICSRSVSCELWSCDMNSTLGSVVPLAMFDLKMNDYWEELTLFTGSKRRQQLSSSTRCRWKGLLFKSKCPSAWHNGCRHDVLFTNRPSILCVTHWMSRKKMQLAQLCVMKWIIIKWYWLVLDSAMLQCGIKCAIRRAGIIDSEGFHW